MIFFNTADARGLFNCSEGTTAKRLPGAWYCTRYGPGSNYILISLKTTTSVLEQCSCDLSKRLNRLIFGNRVFRIPMELPEEH